MAVNLVDVALDLLVKAANLVVIVIDSLLDRHCCQPWICPLTTDVVVLAHVVDRPVVGSAWFSSQALLCLAEPG